MEPEQSDYSLEFALGVARLWKVGKMIGGDPHEVCLALVTHVDELERHLRNVMENLAAWRKEYAEDTSSSRDNMDDCEKAARAYLDGLAKG